MRLPDFIIIGAQKGGTHWLRDNLCAHPDIYLPQERLHYFNGLTRWRGAKWYAAHFDRPEALVGEATPAYMMFAPKTEPYSIPTADVARAIDKTVPDVRLIAALRNPVDRAYSAWSHMVRHQRVPPQLNVTDWVTGVAPRSDTFRIVASGWYARNLTPFVRRFGSRLKVILTDDIAHDPQATYHAVLDHLGAAPHTPDGVGDVVHSYRHQRRELTDDERAQLYTFFRDDIDRLEQLIGRDLSAWRPPDERPDAAD